jgi:hypothetical protein
MSANPRSHVPTFASCAFGACAYNPQSERVPSRSGNDLRAAFKHLDFHAASTAADEFERQQLANHAGRLAGNPGSIRSVIHGDVSAQPQNRVRWLSELEPLVPATTQHDNPER